MEFSHVAPSFFSSNISRIALQAILFYFVFTNVIALSNKCDVEEVEVSRDFGTLHTLDSLMYWAKKEVIIMKLLRERLSLLRTAKDLMIKFKENYEASSGKALKNLKEPGLSKKERGNVIGSSMILSHKMTDRYANVIYNLRNLLNSEEYRETRRQLDIELNLGLDEEQAIVRNFLMSEGILDNKTNRFPNWEDLYISHTALMHIQEIYDTKPQELMVGLPIHTNFGGKLNALHFALLGAFALESKPYYYNAIDSFEMGMRLIREKKDDSFPKALMQNLLFESIQLHNNILNVGGENPDLSVWVETFRKPVTQGQNTSDRVPGRDAYYNHYKSSPTGNDSDDYTRFMGLCNAQSFPDTNKYILKCYLERQRHPYFVLNPVKTEELSKYPDIIKMYDVLGNETISDMLNNRGYGQISLVSGATSLRESFEFRTSMGYMFLENDVDEKINKKTEMLTGLVIDRFDEHVQLVEYIYGRYYAAHRDSFQGELLERNGRRSGNRLGTVIYYLEEPDVAGYTVFCQAGCYTESKRGSAVFWKNLFRNGSERTDVVHGACPVLNGHKISGLVQLPTSEPFHVRRTVLSDW